MGMETYMFTLFKDWHTCMQPDADVAPREFWGYQMHDLERTVYASYRLHSLLLFPECVYIHNPKPMFYGD